MFIANLASELVDALGASREESCALIAPALRSSSRRWPLDRRGATLEIETQVFIGKRGRGAMNAGTEGVSHLEAY